MTRSQLSWIRSDVKTLTSEVTAYSPDEDLLAMIEGMQSLAEVGRVCTALCSSLDFDYFSFDLSLPVLCEKPTRINLNRLPQAWQDHYDKGYFHSRDPVLEQARRSSLPFFWDEIERQSRDSHSFFNAARSFGIGRGLTFPFAAPVNTFATLSFAGRHAFAANDLQRRKLLGNAMWLVANFHEVVRRLALRSNGIEISVGTRLTRRERECLALSGSGYTTSQIATRLNIAPRTVAFHIDRSVTKLGVHSRRAALTRALVLGEIDSRIFERRPNDCC